MMLRKVVRLRGRNQFTLPGEITAALSVQEGDFFEVTMTDLGQVQLTPARLVRMGTSEAEQEDRRAEEDIRAGKFDTFESAEAFANHLRTGREGVQAATAQRDGRALRQERGGPPPAAPAPRHSPRDRHAAVARRRSP